MSQFRMIVLAAVLASAAVVGAQRPTLRPSADAGIASERLARIERQLDRLASRARGRRLDTLVQDGVRFSQILDEGRTTEGG